MPLERRFREIVSRRRSVAANVDSTARNRRKLLILNGGQGRNRTADASLFRAALYQLSYLAGEISV